jgi:DNA invertase Pin-like site-specific DNA recombinase
MVEVIQMKAIIYLRTSTSEQFPEKQKKDCLQFAESRGYEVIEVYQEQLSGYKDIKRPMYEEVKSRAYKGEIQAVIVWALDRWVRNRDTLLEDVTALRNYGCKLHSVQEQWLEAINIEGSLGRTIQDFLLGLVGSLAQMESQRKSERTIMAYQNKTGRWGRKSLPGVTKKKIIEAYQTGTPLRQITKEIYYYDKNKHPKYVSLGVVHKVITEFKQSENTQEDIS